MVGVGLAVILLQLEQAQDQISQSGHGLGGMATRDLASILAQGDIATVMGAAFTSCPMATDALSQLRGGCVLLDQAAGVKTIFLGLTDDLALAYFVAIAPDGDELPAPRQAGLFWIDRDALESPTFQAPVILVPT